ncbi:hypothetical protein ABFV05_017379 [Capra hircus]
MRPRSQLAAARRGGAAACGTRARGRRRLTSRAPRSPAPGSGPAGRERLRPRRPPGPGRRQQTLAASARRLSAGAPGSPLYRVSAPPPAPRAAPPRRRPAPLPERAAAGRAPAGAFVSPGRSGAEPPALRARRAGRPPASTGPRRFSARRPRSGSGGVPVSGPSLRARVRSSGSPGGRPGPEARGRSGVRTPGWRDFGKTNFPVRKRRGPRGSSPPLPSNPLPSAPTPVSPPPPPPTAPRLLSARPARRRHRGRPGASPARRASGPPINVARPRRSGGLHSRERGRPGAHAVWVSRPGGAAPPRAHIKGRAGNPCAFPPITGISCTPPAPVRPAPRASSAARRGDEHARRSECARVRSPGSPDLGAPPRA